MWLASGFCVQKEKNPLLETQRILDLGLSLSPFVGICGQLDLRLFGDSAATQDLLLFPMNSVARYWKLSTFFEPENKAPELLKILSSLHKRFGMTFVLAPTAPWAFWLYHCAPTPRELLSVW